MTRTLALMFLAVAIFSVPADASSMRMRQGSYELQVLANGSPIRSFWHSGEQWLLGQLGERYTLRVLNHSGRPIEAVISVDGRDIIDGQLGDVNKRGYLIPAWGNVDIDGWRISQAQAAAFRFSAVSNSYAARTGSGREVGVIGVAVFEQRVPVAYVPPPVYVAPAPPPCCIYGERYNQPADKEAMNEEAPRASTQSSARQSLGGAMADAAPAQTTTPAAPAAPPAKPMERMAEKKSAQMDSASASGYGAMAQHARRPEPRAGLGTEYGEAVTSYITETTFERASSRPSHVLGCRYNDRAGLIAMGIDVDGTSEVAVRRSADPFPMVDRSFAPPPSGWTP